MHLRTFRDLFSVPSLSAGHGRDVFSQQYCALLFCRTFQLDSFPFSLWSCDHPIILKCCLKIASVGQDRLLEGCRDNWSLSVIFKWFMHGGNLIRRHMIFATQFDYRGKFGLPFPKFDQKDCEWCQWPLDKPWLTLQETKFTELLKDEHKSSKTSL